MRPIRNFFKNENGATAIEYGLIASLIFLAIVVAVGLLSGEMIEMYNTISDAVTANM